MKKTYIKPMLSQYIIESKQTLLTGSAATFTDSLGSTETEGTDGGNALSRGTSIWDDDEEEY